MQFHTYTPSCSINVSNPLGRRAYAYASCLFTLPLPIKNLRTAQTLTDFVIQRNRDSDLLFPTDLRLSHNTKSCNHEPVASRRYDLKLSCLSRPQPQSLIFAIVGHNIENREISCRRVLLLFADPISSNSVQPLACLTFTHLDFILLRERETTRLRRPPYLQIPP